MGYGVDPTRFMPPRAIQQRPPMYEPPPQMSKDEDPRAPIPPGPNKARTFSPETYGLVGGYAKPRSK